jgi:hypothetical protein
MKKEILWVRAFYWLGAILDARVGIILFIRRYLELPGFVQHSGSRAELPSALYGVGQAWALMWGWTCLLIWADRKPIERRGVILLTLFPVILFLLINSIDIVLRGFVSVVTQSINMGIALVLIVSGIYCYIKAGRIEKELI